MTYCTKTVSYTHLVLSGGSRCAHSGTSLRVHLIEETGGVHLIHGTIIVSEVNEMCIRDREYPASITKVMTALLTLEAVDAGKLSLDQPITASAVVNDQDPEGSSAGIEEGEVLTVEQLLYCLLLVSANEAADILAETVSGSREAFVELMNQRAQELGCTGTHFANTNGLHDVNHYTTAYDIYLFFREAMKHETFMTITGSVAYEVPATNKSEARELHTTNSLLSNWRILDYLYDGVDCGKTGSTPEAGYCLVSSCLRDGKRLVAVVLGAEGEGTHIESFSESARLRCV